MMLAIPVAARAQRIDQTPVMTPGMADQSGSYSEQIAAVVNDDIISTADVRARMALSLMTSGLQDSLEVKQHLLPQVLQTLINEQLQLQEGKRTDINVTQEEIDKALNRLSQDNHVPGGNIIAFLRSQNVPPSSMINQVRAALTWNKVAQRQLRPRVDVGDDEIDAVIERTRANAGKQEYLVSEIFLPMDSARDEQQIKTFAESLMQQMRGGKNFGAIARQFSQGTGAANGGDIGWIQAGQLAPDLDKLLQSTPAGDIGGPVRTSNGYHIMGVREKRTIAFNDPKDVKEASVNLQQAFLPFTAKPDREAVLQEATMLRQSISSCGGLSAKLASDFPAWRWQDLGDVKIASAPSWLSEKVRNIKMGEASEPMATDKGALILFVCSRTMPENINRDEILNTIGTERIELLARRLLRDLRRNAYLDIRLKAAQ